MSDHAIFLVTAIGTVATALATVGLWLVGWRTLGGARDQLRLLQEQARAEGRPYVVLEVVPGLHPAPSLDLVIRNTGRSMARNLTLEAAPMWESNGEGDYITDALQKFMVTPRLVAPGARVRILWSRHKENEAVGAPTVCSITATYQDDGGKTYADRYDFALEEYLAAAPVPSTGSKTSGNNSDLKNITLAIRGLSTHLGELRR